MEQAKTVVHRTPVSVVPGTRPVRGGSVQTYRYSFTCTFEDGSKEAFTGADMRHDLATKAALKRFGRMCEHGYQKGM